MRDAYIVSAVRTPGCRRAKGAFAQTRPEDLLKTAINGLFERCSGIGKEDVQDILIGCCFPEAEQGLNIGKIITQMTDFPDQTSGATINRFCASGLESVAVQTMRIRNGWCDIAVAGGLESMTIVPMGGNLPRPHPELAEKKPDTYVSMGITAETVAKRYNITREMQDEFAYHSQMKAGEANRNRLFTEIIPTPADKYVKQKDGSVIKEIKIQEIDDGVRSKTTMDELARLKPVFSSFGTVTAGNSSQMTDGAAAVLLMSGEAANKAGIKPVARLVNYAVVGVKPDEMGVGPAYAIPKLLGQSGIGIDKIDLFEINEAFASQAVYSLQKLGLYDDRSLWQSDSMKRKVNINGGAIAIGHPVGCTGTKLAVQLVARMKEKGLKYGVESMCVGGGMGAAALFESVE